MGFQGALDVYSIDAKSCLDFKSSASWEATQTGYVVLFFFPCVLHVVLSFNTTLPNLSCLYFIHSSIEDNAQFRFGGVGLKFSFLLIFVSVSFVSLG